MEYINFNDPKVPIGKRKQAYVKYAVSRGTSLEEAKRQANKKFGFERTEKWIALIGNAGDMDLPSMRGYSWADAARDAGVPVHRCKSCIIVCDGVYSPFDICDGFDIIPNTWKHFGRSLPHWNDYKAWAEKNGYKVSRINWITP